MRVHFSREPSIETVAFILESEKARGVIPTTFVPLAPERILYGKDIDLLFGVFHIMWKDMPRPRRYEIRLADRVSRQGEYLGCCLKCGFPRIKTIEC